MKRTKIMLIFGTRPEAIKMAPVVARLREFPDEFETYVVVTAQHRSMLDQALGLFDIEPDCDLDIMLPGQTLTEVTTRALIGLEEVIKREKPDLALVQGDTTTAFVGGLAAYYNQTPVGHIEAGLRTNDKYNPYPEELNRHFLDVMSDLCFVPTSTAKAALLAEGVPDERIFITGNTVIDALLTAASHPHQFALPALRQLEFGPEAQTILVTAHRRENLGTPMRDVCLALRDLLEVRRELQVVFPVHLNPKVRETVWSVLGEIDRAWLIEPLDYLDFVHVMKRVHLVITDSGGVQEEAPTLGVPVLVIRTATERPEAVEAGAAKLIGVARQDIVAEVSDLLDNPEDYARMKRAVNPYGDGHAARRTVDAIRYFFGFIDAPPLGWGLGAGE